MRLVLIRHGETDWNVIGRYQGQADPPLNSRGYAQSLELAKKLEGVGLEVIYTSPLLRAAQTAGIIAEHLMIPLYPEPRFMEIHQGDWQTRLRAEIESLYPDLFQRWESDPWEVSPPNGETLIQVQARVYTALDDVITRHPDQCVGLVSHRIPIALIKLRYQQVEPNIVRTLHLPNVYFEGIEVHLDKEEE